MQPTAIRLAWTQPNPRLGRPWRAEINRHRYEIATDHRGYYVATEIRPDGTRHSLPSERLLSVAKAAACNMATATVRSQLEEV